MRKIKRRALLLALAITLIIMGALTYYLQVQFLNVGPLERVVIAVEDIPPKTAITSSHITEKEIPKRFVTPGGVGEERMVVGKITKEKIYQGEIILGSRLIDTTGRDGLATIIPEGYRAITVRIDTISGVGRSINTGDFVDILVYTAPPHSQEERVETIFQSIEVIDLSPDSQEFLTLIMLPQDIEKLFLFDEIGKIRFVLRPILDTEKTPLQGARMTLPKEGGALDEEENQNTDLP